jgi:protein TonB
MYEMGNLANCMVECDREALGRERSVRRKALVISSALELSLIAAVILWPLVTPGVISQRVTMTPVPPFRGLPQAQAPSEHAKPASSDQTPRMPTFVTVMHAPQRAAAESSDAEPPSVYDPLATGSYGSSPGMPGGTGGGSVSVAPPRPVATGAGPVHVSSGVMLAALIYRVEPVYPPIAKIMHLEGTVNLRAIIRTNGLIGQLTVVDGNPILAVAAEAAVRQWRYNPTLLNDQPVEVDTIVTVNFRLQ